MKEWKQFLEPYKQAVAELKVKFKGLRTQYELEGDHMPVEFVTGRVKPLASIYDKTLEKRIPFKPSAELAEELPDIAGIRIMCQFVDDIGKVVTALQNRTDLRIIEERDYISNKKPSGYRSFHMIIEYPVQTIHGEKTILAEIQIRTLAMNFWASIEHSLNYKYQGELPNEIRHRLERAAEAAFRLDEEMSLIRDEIHDAQQYFSAYKETADRDYSENTRKGE
ncbi:GTP pyrophosphokinase family protein [Sporosarcina sp. Sa2YVA2]|uniref:GTP pyrophosphokinase family protein n=1 Tax=Sporosarcina quadrami TaxID=2762234 RepID=A0ABR8UAS5_9BACL|nr:GTP pyrophosphokinase family protein [Sporosarcina quadrami]MBD7985096.1 GTP pyrophosphokinase family protein [Sporosarcina quadrami]